jgi:amino acid adenylation domain-containing protein
MAEQWPPMQAVEFDPFAQPPGEAPAAPALLPLSATQRELYAAVQMGPQAHCAFNLAYVLDLRGPFSLPSLQSALQLVVDRHAALRMRILPDGQAQELLPRTAVALPMLDLKSLGEAEQQDALAEVVEAETHTPFDLQQAGLWRARVLELAQQHHLLVFTVHHLASDGWSSSVLFGDLAAAYAADRFGMPARLPEALRYEDYLQRQHSAEWRADEQRSRDYWMARHSPPAHPLSLPADHPRPAFKTYACSQARVTLDAALSAALRKLGARHGCTLFVTLLAVCQGLVARLCGSTDVVIGVPMANQALLDNGHVVAHGANTVPLRLAVELERPFGDWLPQVRRSFLDAQAHQHLSFGNLVHALKLPRDPSRTPLVDVLFNIDRIGAPFDFGELRLERIHTPKAFGNAEWSVNVIDNGRELVVECDYNSTLFDAPTPQRWLDLYQHALQRLVAEPALTLAQALAPSPAETALLACWNDTAADYPQQTRLEDAFAQVVARDPDAAALWCAGYRTSYRELDGMANGVAHALRAAGVMPGDRVGLYCGRTQAMVAGVLGVLKAGAAYVPLDPAYPDERLALMTADAQLRLVACDAQTEADWRFGAVRLLRLDRCEPAARAPASAGAAADPAYVIYTSGSTGTPKGVVIAHRSVMNFVSSVARRPGIAAQDRLAAVATLSFDMSVLDLFLPLTTGASIVLVDRAEVQDGQRLAERLRSSGATVMQAAPSIWRLLLDAGWPGSPGFCAFVGGEALPPDLAVALAARCAALWNFYGPTETTVYSSCWPVPREPAAIRVGTPVANTQIHILDEQLRPLPLGAVGEICIGGDGVALGYHARPELTAERFVPDAQHPHWRLYRTGDLGRWHNDGTLECLGRNDQQIKLRGYRIELGEIESALMRAPGVERACVMLREDTPGDARLVAYVVRPGGAGSGPMDPRAWREELRRRLPEFMLPSHVLDIPSLPLLPNGKIDRHQLPAPASVAPTTDATVHAPVPTLTPNEEAVAAIWRQLLQLEAIGPSDNFFDLGGHSLLAARASQALEARLGFKVGVPRLVMETLAQIAQKSANEGATDQPLPARAGWLRRLTEGLRRV